MNPLTKYSATDPVVFSKMNDTLEEIEARDNELQQQINVLKGQWAGITLLNGWSSAWEGVEPVYSLNGNILTVKGMITGGTTTNGTPIFKLPRNALKLQNIKVQQWDTQNSVFGVAAGDFFGVAYSALTWSSTVIYLLDLEIVLVGGTQI